MEKPADSSRGGKQKRKKDKPAEEETLWVQSKVESVSGVP